MIICIHLNLFLIPIVFAKCTFTLNIMCIPFFTHTDCTELSLGVLYEELKTVTDPIKLGIDLGMPQRQLEIMSKNPPGILVWDVLSYNDVLNLN